MRGQEYFCIRRVLLKLFSELEEGKKKAILSANSGSVYYRVKQLQSRGLELFI